MKRKSTDQSVGSLELLLDTICNTFGGILLISLLVALLLNATSRKLSDETASPESRAALLQTEIERDRLARQLKELRAAVESREKVVGELLPEELIAEADKFHEAELHHAELVSRKSDDIGGASRAQKQLNEIIQGKAELHSKLEQKRREAASASKLLDQQVAARSQDVSIPRIRMATTSPRAYFMTQKRIFGPWPSRQFAAGNSDEFIEESRGTERVLLPKPGAGISIPTNEVTLQQIKERFGNVDPQDEHVRIFVWPDSYAEFEPVRRAVNELGLMLELEPMPRNAEVTIGARTAPAFVQ